MQGQLEPCRYEYHGWPLHATFTFSQQPTAAANIKKALRIGETTVFPVGLIIFDQHPYFSRKLVERSAQTHTSPAAGGASGGVVMSGLRANSGGSRLMTELNADRDGILSSRENRRFSGRAAEAKRRQGR